MISVNSAVAHVGMPAWAFRVCRSRKIASAKIFDYFRAENHGIRVVQFHPGVIMTEMASKSVDAGTDPAIRRWWVSFKYEARSFG